MSYIIPIKEINFKEFKKKNYLTLEQSPLEYNFTKNIFNHFCAPQSTFIGIYN